ncbi:MAG: tetratricopeptide (TPR) repeat protein [Verrucomicrobiales bacterium]
MIIATLAIATVISVQQAVRAKRAEQAASIEAHLATSVSEFLYHDILEQANPLVSDRNITLREVLDRGVEKIDARFHDQPLVLSQLKWIIGRTYTGLSEYERAESLLANSVEIQTRLRGVHDERTMDAMESLGWLYGLQGRLEEAERQHRQVLELRRQNLGDKSLGVVASMNQLGEVLKKRGDLDAARRCAEEAVSTATEIMGENDDLRIAALVSLGQIQTKQRQVDQAERTFKEIMKLRPTAEPGDAMALGALSGLGNLYSDHGRPQEAEPFQQQALAMQRKVFGETSPNTHNALHNLAVTTFHLGRTQEALAMAREAADGSREKLGASHPHTLKFMGTTAFLAVESGDTTTAEKLWTEALEAQLDTLGGEHFETLRTALNLAQFYQEQGRPNEAKEHYLSCLERMPTQRELLDAFEDHVFLSAIAPLAPDAEFHPISFRYTVERPSAEWIVRDFDDSVWDSGPAPFGNRAQEKRSDWNTPEIWLRRDFDAEGTLEGELVLRVFHDDDITVYLNGVLAYEKTGTSRGNYQAVPCIAAANSALRVGKNTLAVHCANTGGDRQVVDVGLFVDSQSTEQQWIDVLSQLIERKPDIPSWHGRRAEALGRLAQWSAFEEDITKILQLDPTEYLGFVAELPLSKDEQASIVKRQRDARDALEDRNASAVWDADRVVRIIPGGSDWSYLDNGEFAGDDWQQESHDDDHWSAGPAPLGYGESDLRTELRSGSDEERHATTYFRHPFTAQPQDIQALKLRVRWDDGVAVYLNGHEVYRENLDPNATFSDFSSGKVGGAEETAYHVVLVDPSLLKSGANLIAVEIHQCDVTSSDLVFDLEMESLRKELR